VVEKCRTYVFATIQKKKTLLEPLEDHVNRRKQGALTLNLLAPSTARLNIHKMLIPLFHSNSDLQTNNSPKFPRQRRGSLTPRKEKKDKHKKKDRKSNGKEEENVDEENRRHSKHSDFTKEKKKKGEQKEKKKEDLLKDIEFQNEFNGHDGPIKDTTDVKNIEEKRKKNFKKKEITRH